MNDELQDDLKAWLHREDGPAIQGINGVKGWFLNGVQYSENEFNSIQLEKKLQAELSDEHMQSKKLKI